MPNRYRLKTKEMFSPRFEISYQDLEFDAQILTTGTCNKLKEPSHSNMAALDSVRSANFSMSWFALDAREVRLFEELRTSGFPS